MSLFQCDEAKPVCRKCAVHYDYIIECDYRQGGISEAENAEETPAMPKDSTLKTLSDWRAAGSRTRSLPATRLRSVSPSLLDPFKSLPECKEPDLDMLMKIFFTKHIYNIFPYYPTPRLNPVIEYYAPMICKDVLLMHVSMLCVSLRQEHRDTPSGRARSKRLNAECNRLLQDRINSTSPACTSDTTVCAIAALTNIENGKGNLRHAQTHLMGLKRVLDIRGGLDAIRASHATIANIVFCAFVSAADDDFPRDDLNRPIERPPWFWNAVQNDTDNPCIDFHAHGVSLEHAELMVNMRLLAKTYRTAKDCKTVGEYQDVLTFLTSTLQRLMSLNLPEAPITYEGRITTACRHALVVQVFLQWCGHDPDPHLMVSIARHELLMTLRQLMEPGISNYLLLWLLSVGGAAHSGQPARKWFVSQLADMTEDLAISSWQGMRATLKQVIWHDVQDEKQQLQLWEEVTKRKEDERDLQAAYMDELSSQQRV